MIYERAVQKRETISIEIHKSEIFEAWPSLFRGKKINIERK